VTVGRGKRSFGHGWARTALAPFLLCVLAAPAQPAAGPGSQQAARAALSWPEPPAPARVAFVRVLTPAVAGGRPSRLRRVLDAITGGSSVTPALAQPHGIAVDDAGQVFVADTFAGMIHVFDVPREKYSTLRVAGRSLIGVATIGDRLFVTDSADARVTCLDKKGRRIWSVGREAGFKRPTGIVADGDRLHVVDTLAHQVVTVGLAGEVTGRFGSHGSDPGQFNFPTSIARGPNGRLYVTDSMNFRIETYTPDGIYQGGFGEIGDGSGDFGRPKGVALDGDGHVYVVEGLADVVQIFDWSGRFLLAFGEPGAGEGQFWLPTAIAIRDDVIYVADTANRRVQVFRYLKERP